MAIFQIGKDFETLERAGMAGWFQVDTLLDDEGNDITDIIDVGQHFESNDNFIEYLAPIVNLPEDEIDIEEL